MLPGAVWGLARPGALPCASCTDGDKIEAWVLGSKGQVGT